MRDSFAPNGRAYGLGVFAVAIAALLWATTGTAATFAPAAGPIAIGALAMTSGGLLQGLRALPQIGTNRAFLRQRIPLLAVAAAAVAIYPLAFYGAMYLAGVTIGTVVAIGSAPLASAVIERLIDGRALDRRWLIAATLGIGGMTLLCLAHGDNVAGTARADHIGAGIAVGLVAGLTYALFSWAAGRLMHQGLAPRVAMGTIFGLGALLLVPVLLMTGDVFLASVRNAAVGLYLALVPMFLGYLCYGYGLARIPASRATTITLLEPAVAALLGVVVVGERLALPGWAGIALILASLVCITWTARITHTRRHPKMT